MAGGVSEASNSKIVNRMRGKIKDFLSADMNQSFKISLVVPKSLISLSKMSHEPFQAFLWFLFKERYFI